MKKVYLSGGMEYADGEGAQWRSQMQHWIESTLKHDVFNPNVESYKFFNQHYPDIDVRKLKLEKLPFSPTLSDTSSISIARRSLTTLIILSVIGMRVP